MHNLLQLLQWGRRGNSSGAELNLVTGDRPNDAMEQDDGQGNAAGPNHPGAHDGGRGDDPVADDDPNAQVNMEPGADDHPDPPQAQNPVEPVDICPFEAEIRQWAATVGLTVGPGEPFGQVLAAVIDRAVNAQFERFRAVAQVLQTMNPNILLNILASISPEGLAAGGDLDDSEDIDFVPGQLQPEAQPPLQPEQPPADPSANEIENVQPVQVSDTTGPPPMIMTRSRSRGRDTNDPEGTPGSRQQRQLKRLRTDPEAGSGSKSSKRD